MKLQDLLFLAPLLLFSSGSPQSEKEVPLETIPVNYRMETSEDPDDFSLPPLTPFF